MTLRIDDFISNLMRKGSLNPTAENTRKAYRMTLGKFERFLDGREATGELAQEFVQQEMERGLKSSSVARYGRAIKRYLEWEGKPKDALMVLLPTPGRKPVAYLELEQVYALVTAARTPLEKAVVVVLVETGLRISELLALRERDIDRAGGFLYAHREKTGMEGWIPISEDALSVLDEYIRWAKPKDKLFPQGYDQIYRWLKELGQQVGLKVHPHLLRHSAAALRRISGQTRETLADLLGHKKTDTTRIYDSIKPPELKREVKPIFGRK